MDTLACLCLAGLSLCSAPPSEQQNASSIEPAQRYEFAQTYMGVSFNITLYSPDQVTANKAAQAAFERVDQIDKTLSDYQPSSETTLVCRSAMPGHPVEVSAELLAVLQRSQIISCQTNGAFDVTVGPIIRLWRRARRRGEFPDSTRLADARQLVGYRLLRINDQNSTVEFSQIGMRLDFGAIGKGYAIDQALYKLREHGIESALIDAGGDIVLSDAPPGRNGWRVGIAPLEAENAPPSHVLQLSNVAVATSGDAFQFVEIDGVRYSHIIDPRTGVALTRRSSVTIIAPDATTADGFASAVAVLGPGRGFQIIDGQCGLAAFIVESTEDGVRTHQSKRFSNCVLESTQP